MMPQTTTSQHHSSTDTIEHKLILPSGMTKIQAFTKHSMPNLLTEFDPTVCPVQFIPYQGLHNYAMVIPNSMEAFAHAIGGEKREEGNITQVSPIWFNGEPYILQNIKNEHKTPFGNGPWARVIHSSYISVTPLFQSLWDLLCHTGETIVLDGHNEGAAKLVALLSVYRAFQPNVLVQLYPYVFRNGGEFIDIVNTYVGHHPSKAWQRVVSIAPVLAPDTLPMLAHVEQHSEDYQILYNAGKAWIESMVNDTGMKIFGLGFIVSGIGYGVNLDTGETYDLNQNLVTKPNVKALFLWDRVLLDLVAWAKQSYHCPTLPIIILSTPHSYSQQDIHHASSTNIGEPTMAWSEDAENHGRELMAIPGNAMQLGANIVICDNINDNLNVALGTRSYTLPTNVNYLLHNVERGIENMSV